MVSFYRYIFIICCLLLQYTMRAQEAPWEIPVASLVSTPIYINCNPQINYQVLAEGDYIGVFNEEGRCFGLSRWKDTINFKITVYGSDGVTDGFNQGDKLAFRLWLHNENCVLENVSLISSDRPLLFSNVNSLMITSLNFERGAINYPFSEYCLNEGPVKPQLNYPLKDLGFQANARLNIDPTTGIIQPSNSQPGTYSITLNTNTCLVSKNLQMTLKQIPEVTSIPDTLICGEKLNISLSLQNEQVQWSTGDTDPNVELADEGTIWYKVVNPEGCSNSDTFNLKRISITEFDYQVEKADCYTKGAIDILKSEITNGRPPYTYKLVNQLDNSEVENLSSVPEGIYTYLVTNANGCELSYKSRIVVEKDCLEDKPVFTPNEDGRDDKYFLNIEGRIDVFNRNGQLIRQLTGPCYFDGNDSYGKPLPMGVYMIVPGKGKSFVITIVK
jgi:hypothetical protein